MSRRESEAGSAFVPLAAASSAESSGIIMSDFGDAAEQKRPMRIKLGVAASAARLGSERSGRAKRLHQPDDERNRHAEKRGSGMTRPATLDKAGNPFTQIERIGFRHSESPPG